jgi:hypothetical protein
VGKAKDLVISYAISGAGKVANHDALQQALDDGYRVVDVFATPADSGGGNGIGSVVVTVLLSLPGEGTAYRGKGKD